VSSESSARYGSDHRCVGRAVGHSSSNAPALTKAAAGATRSCHDPRAKRGRQLIMHGLNHQLPRTRGSASSPDARDETLGPAKGRTAPRGAGVLLGAADLGGPNLSEVLRRLPVRRTKPALSCYQSVRSWLLLDSIFQPFRSREIWRLEVACASGTTDAFLAAVRARRGTAYIPSFHDLSVHNK